MRFNKIITLIITSCVHLTTAFREISIPSVVNANQTVQLTIANDLSSGPGSYDAQFTTFRIYLAIIAPTSSYIPNPVQPSCYLVNATSITTSVVNLTIPTSVGPDGTSYHVGTLEYSTHPNPPPPSSYSFSPTFTLYNTTSSWSSADLNGDYPPFPDLLPCTSYDCARQCLSSTFPQNINGTEAGFQGTYECMAACPGVTYPSWAEVQKEGAGPGQTLAGDGNEGAQTVEVAYATLLRSVSAMPTPTANGTRNASMTLMPTASTTGKGDASVVRVGNGWWAGVILGLATFVL
jgi:hypothetical protein